MALKFPERLRVDHPLIPSEPGQGGPFVVRGPNRGPLIGRKLFVIASNGAGWEHVSVSVLRKGREPPSWSEMAFVKELFWEPEDVVMQLHPPRSQYVNNFEGCLHLWRPINGLSIPLPPSILVGIKGPTHDDLDRMTPEQHRALLQSLPPEGQD